MSVDLPESDPQAAALFYASLGWRCLPMHGITAKLKCTCGDPCKKAKPGKHPRISGWQHTASTDPTIIGEWFTRWPDANVGALCGARSGIVVMDCDGEEGHAALERLGGTAQLTVVQTTGRVGGAHYFFAHPGGRVTSTVGLEPGLDVRGDGSLVVVAPSRHKSGGAYRWERGREPGAVPLAPLPPLLLAALRNGNGAGKATKAVRVPGVPVREGERNPTLFALAVALNHAGLSEAGIRSALKVENAGYVPPLRDSEVSDVIASALSGKYEPNGRQPAERQIGPDDFPCWAHAVLRSDLSRMSKLYLLMLSTFDLGDIGRGCTVDQEALAERLGCDVKTIQRSKKNLVARGLLGVEPRPTARGQLPDIQRVDRVRCAALPEVKPKRQKRCLGVDTQGRDDEERPGVKNGVSKESLTGGGVPKGQRESARPDAPTRNELATSIDATTRQTVEVSRQPAVKGGKARPAPDVSRCPWMRGYWEVVHAHVARPSFPIWRDTLSVRRRALGASGPAVLAAWLTSRKHASRAPGDFARHLDVHAQVAA